MGTAFDTITDLYRDNEDFVAIWKQCQGDSAPQGFKILEGFLFKENQLCIPKNSLWLHLINETHAGGLADHFGRDKSVAQLESRFQWCAISQESKGTRQKIGSYMPLPMATEHGRTSQWILCLVFQELEQASTQFFVVVNHFSKMVHFLPCRKTNDASHIAKLFFKEIVHLHEVLSFIVFNRYPKFISHFGGFYGIDLSPI